MRHQETSVEQEGPQRTLLLILVPMLLTFAIQRTILHHSSPETHVFVGGYLVHHLFSGALLLIPSAFMIAFGSRYRPVRTLSRVLLGVGTAMVLDEIVFLVCTDGSGEAYRNRVSFWGAFLLIGLASATLWSIYRAARKWSTS
ncbi:MAG TPA: hypothetical protein VE981_12415 [Planctomycetota bacterium]|nr:hypothetical protein [Planctomycetota bacterium]